MSSKSLDRWRSDRSAALDELEAAHRSVGGTKRGRRFATQQINQAYAVLLSSQFQGFCRDLHTECAELFVQTVPAGLLRTSLQSALVRNRRLDRGNPTRSSLNDDYNQFGLAFFDEVRALDSRNESRLRLIEELNAWRNAIAHQNFEKLGGAQGASVVLRLNQVRRWRAGCDRLAMAFDDVLRSHLAQINGVAPW